jgi:hypothetical protein
MQGGGSSFEGRSLYQELLNNQEMLAYSARIFGDILEQE